MINAGVKAVGWGLGLGYSETPNLVPTQRTRRQLSNMGLIPDPNVPAEGAAEQASEIFGTGIAPTGLFMSVGNRILAQSISQMERMGVIKNLALCWRRYRKGCCHTQQRITKHDVAR
jgi:hypothetical protein